MSDYSYAHKRNVDDALFAKLKAAERVSPWRVYVTENGLAYFTDGIVHAEALIESLERDFEFTMYQVELQFREARKRAQPSGLGAPWHEFDQSGRHISEKSG